MKDRKKIPIKFSASPYEKGFYLPPIGRRIAKTTVAVFICLVIYAVLGFEGDSMPTESAITAIMCMQQDVHDARNYALSRITATIIGILWGIGLLLLLTFFPSLGQNQLILYTLMAFGVMMTLYTTVLLRVPHTASLAAMVFLCLVISFPEIDQPYAKAASRVLDIFIGTAVAISVNIFRLPRWTNHDRIYYLYSEDLVPDRFTHVSPTVLYKLNSLYSKGARICLISRHAPAFFAVQMRTVKITLPLIVMDGAAVFDANENTYLHVENLPGETSAALRQCMDQENISYFIYTVHNNKTCIFHHGEIHEQEKALYERMKRSPYRTYLEGEVYDPSQIVYFKIIGDQNLIDQAQKALAHILSRDSLRIVQRAQDESGTIMGLYIYSGKATVEKTREQMMKTIWEKENTRIMPVEFKLPYGYRSEHETVNLLRRVENDYEPLWILRE